MRSMLAVSICAALLQSPSPSPAQPPAAEDPVKALVARLDLEKYKATIKGLTRFGDRRQGTARNRAAIDQPVMPGRHKRSVPNRDRRRHPGGNHAAEQTVEMTVTHEIVGKDVVGHQAPGVIKLAGGQ